MPNYTKAEQGDKLQRLAENEGFDDPLDMIEEYFNDGLMPGICMNDGCDYTISYEPDQDRGWCENCGSNTVVSALILAGIM